MIEYVKTTRDCRYSSSVSEFTVTGDDQDLFIRAMLEGSELDMGDLLNDKSVQGIKVRVYSIDRSDVRDLVIAYHVNSVWGED